MTDFEAADADPDATYQDVRTVDLSALEPYVARPGTVSRNGTPVSQIEYRRIDQAFIGSCANGQLEDLRIAASIVRGRQVAPGVRLLITPASQQVYRDAMRAGYLQDLADAGAVVTNSTCGAQYRQGRPDRGLRVLEAPATAWQLIAVAAAAAADPRARQIAFVLAEPEGPTTFVLSLHRSTRPAERERTLALLQQALRSRELPAQAPHTAKPGRRAPVQVPVPVSARRDQGTGTGPGAA